MPQRAFPLRQGAHMRSATRRTVKVARQAGLL